MAKYHINSKGEPAICRAKKGNCPFGGADSHYDNLKAAQDEANKRNEEEYSLLPKSKTKGKKTKKFYKKATKNHAQYIKDRKLFLKHESKSPTYIEKCRSCSRLKDPSFYKKERDRETIHFEEERKGRIDKLDSIYGEGESVGFYNVNHRLKGRHYVDQVVEIRSTGQLIIYDKEKGHKVTSFMGHRARIETMMILAGEIPDEAFMDTVLNNHTKDLARQSIDRKVGLA